MFFQNVHVQLSRRGLVWYLLNSSKAHLPRGLENNFTRFKYHINYLDFLKWPICWSCNNRKQIIPTFLFQQTSVSQHLAVLFYLFRLNVLVHSIALPHGLGSQTNMKVSLQPGISLNWPESRAAPCPMLPPGRRADGIARGRWGLFGWGRGGLLGWRGWGKVTGACTAVGCRTVKKWGHVKLYLKMQSNTEVFKGIVH